jgi:acyl carrier protein
MMPAAKLTEDEFIACANTFLAGRLGDGASFDPDTDLVGAGGLDSLAMLEFFFFIEEQRGEPIDTAGFSLQMISSIRAAYKLASATTAKPSGDRGRSSGA